jgi:M6 family metalloprotease-like protein
VTNSSGYSDDTELTQREHQLLADAVNAVSGQIPPDLDVDGDDDGYVDNVAFIIQGATDGWSSLLWPHRWALYSAEAYINGARVWDYNFQLSEAFGVSVLCHEMFHTIGAPDLYHYSSDGLQPIGQWDLMEYNTSIPQHMTAYMKYRYGGWINAITEITAPGTYLLTPLSISSTGSCYKIPTSNSLTESFVVEYRKKTAGTFDQGIPGSGLLVYRINTLMDGEGNQNGPPDEVYIFRPDGTASVNGSWTQAHFSSETGRTQINSLTNPRPFLSDGANGGLDISDIGSATDSIAFNVNMPEQEIAVFSEETNIASGAITAVNFGFTSPGSPIIKIFTVLNGGYGTLEMSDLSIPDGYSLIGEFPTNIAPNSRDSFQIQLHAASPGAYTGLIAFNTNDPDENPFSFPVSADVTCVQEVLLEITTDDFGGETTWELKDSQNNILFSGGPYASGQIFPYSIILPSGDYAFTIYDEYGDGICCDYGSGSYSLRNVSTGDVYIGGGGMFGNQETTPFSIEIDKNGDIDGNCLVELQDAILSLQLSSEITPNSPIEIDGDVNGDGKIGVAESIYVLEKISEKRE